ncbi:hypothetical protein PsorP6_000871 [Peronosclerospora sorghi]|uniref:Uncharacterized protein n=1 Tax=Peronosclerospora sorghi TaxID=230839 RepID=A0ACC0WY85_9STRA|nr:hypothetical protein PsorP6_000871 [Peronosclerospora sorghi]
MYLLNGMREDCRVFKTNTITSCYIETVMMGADIWSRRLDKNGDVIPVNKGQVARTMDIARLYAYI